MTAPSVQILLDNFLGAFPYDITAYQQGDIMRQAGRQDEFEAIGAGSMTLTLDNTDGRFTLGSGTYGIGLNQRIRLIVNGVTRFTGYVQSWPVTWPGGSQYASEVQVTATDAFARIGQGATLRSSLEEEILLDSPTAYYTFGEAAGATQAADSSGNGITSLAPAGTGSAVVFGNGVGPSSDGLTAAQMSGGQYLRAESSSNLIGAAWSIEAWVNIAAAPVGGSMGILVMQDLGVSATGMVVNTSGQIIAGGITGPNICDGNTHQVVVTYDGGTFQALYVDGAFVGSSAGGFASMNVLTVGAVLLSNFNFTGTISHVATYGDDLLSGRVASHYSAGHNDFLGETPAARIARLASYSGLTTTSLDTAGGTLCGKAMQSGRVPLDCLNETAEAMLGFVYLTGSGQVTSVAGYSIVGDTSPDATILAEYADPGTIVEADMSFVMNEITGKSTSSENVYGPVGNAFSQVVHGLYHEDFTWNVSTDAQVADRTQWMLNVYAGPSYRYPSLTFDVFSMLAPATASMLLLEPTKFLHLSGMPSQTPGGDADLIVQGITETISNTAWTIELNCAKHTNYAAWILGDSFWGVLGGTTKLYAA